MNPVLSIVVTAHNAERTLGRTLDSILNAISQGEDACEIVIVNDASEDGTSRIVSEFAAQNFLFTRYYNVSFRNIGLVRNFAVQHCLGDYITMVDSDDIVSGQAFFNALTLLKEEAPDVFLTRLIKVHEEDMPSSETVIFEPKRISREKLIRKYLAHKEVQSHFIGQFIRRELLSGICFPDFTCYEDSFTFPQVLANAEKILYSRVGFYQYLKNNNSLSNSIDAEKLGCLIEATQKVDTLFYNAYKNLVICRWIDILVKYGDRIKDTETMILLRKRVARVSYFSFITDPGIRVSYKRKLLTLARAR
ncbi:glycosyltransferase family 2 protein [Tatumella ptyseos]|uniref:glycosyltransferase family 2 protein n=1 Tax=Tatumella ptyseos TaxID=82987 RepID=UPI0023F17D93|nr:glycosyltransferase family 2 protein [Tatumella ptyseos]